MLISTHKRPITNPSKPTRRSDLDSIIGLFPVARRAAHFDFPQEGGRHEYRNASDYRSCLDIARWWWVVREGSLVLTAYVGSTASDDRADARGGKQFSGYNSTCRSPKPDRQNDLDFQQPGKKYLAHYHGSGALVCK